VHVVDDNQDAARTLALLLEMDGHQVSLSFDGQSTLAHAAAHDSDVFVLDIGLPDMDGTELAQRLRAMPAHAGKSIIALTGYGQAADRARSQAAGFDHHLVKPVNYEQLSGLLQERARRGGSAAPAALGQAHAMSAALTGGAHR
jgi:CheY-like chemotaxis protein